MATLSKRAKLNKEAVEPGKQYPLAEGLGLLKELSKVKFDETVDVCVNLGIDPRKSDQVVRGATILPHGTGRTLRVAVFAQGPKAEEAMAAGADKVGYEDLAQSIKGGELDFDVLIATPDAMRLVGQLGQVLGPRGLMPNPKVGTVTQEVGTAVKNAKGGQVRYRTDKGGIIHCILGKCSFSVEHLAENLTTLIGDLKKAKPSSAKGIYLKKVSVSSTMGPGLIIDTATIDVT